MAHAIKEYQITQSYSASFWDQLGIPARGSHLHQALHNGVPYSVFKQLASIANLEHKALAEYLAIPQATLHRRAKQGRFKVDESDRLYRFAEILKSTTDLFEGDRQQARQWLLHPVKGLGGRRPVEMLTTSAEAGSVLDLIGRLEHGVFA